MNAKNLERFHEYLCDVTEYYRENKTLRNFSSLAKTHNVKAITRELFFQFDLDKLKCDPTRGLSDRIRYTMSEIDMQRRASHLSDYRKEQEMKKSAEVTVLQQFEKHMERLNGYINKVRKAAHEAWLEDSISNPRMSGEDDDARETYNLMTLSDWKDSVEYEAAFDLFGNMSKKELCESIPSMGNNTLHAFLTYILQDSRERQTKFDFDARGGKSVNDDIERTLAEYGIFNDVLFHKLESWKGCGHMCIVYKDAPDVLMIIGEEGDENYGFYTVEDDVYYSYCGQTIISPGSTTGFGGWGTRSLLAECIRKILTCKQSAIEMQKSIDSTLQGKLMDDLRNYDEIREMYKEDYETREL